MKRFLFIISFAIVALAVIAQGASADHGDGCCCEPEWKSGPGSINVDMISPETYKYLDMPKQKTPYESLVEAFGPEFKERWDALRNVGKHQTTVVIE